MSGVGGGAGIGKLLSRYSERETRAGHIKGDIKENAFRCNGKKMFYPSDLRQGEQ